MTDPMWDDGCGHGKQRFVGSCSGEVRSIVYDIYIFPTKAGWDVCLRYSDIAHEYSSPGGVSSLLAHAERYYGESVSRIIHTWVESQLKLTLPKEAE